MSQKLWNSRPSTREAILKNCGILQIVSSYLGGPDEQRQQQPGSVTVSTRCFVRLRTECLLTDALVEGGAVRGARRGGQDRRRRVDERSGPLIVKKAEMEYYVLKFCRY